MAARGAIFVDKIDLRHLRCDIESMDFDEFMRFLKKKGEIYENDHGVVDRSSQGGDCFRFGQGGGNKRYRIKGRKTARTV